MSAELLLTCHDSEPQAGKEAPFRNNRLIFSAVIRSDSGPMDLTFHVLMIVKQRSKVTKKGILDILKFQQGLILFRLRRKKNAEMIEILRRMKSFKITSNSVSFAQDRTINRVN